MRTELHAYHKHKNVDLKRCSISGKKLLIGFRILDYIMKCLNPF